MSEERKKLYRDGRKLITTELPEALLKAFESLGEGHADLVRRFRNARDPKIRQACANHLAFNFDREMWELYFKLVEGAVPKNRLWVRLVDFEVEKGIGHDVSRRAAKRGLIPDARLLPDGTAVVPSDCEFQPRGYRRKKEDETDGKE